MTIENPMSSMTRVIHRHSIAFKFTLWYLALLGIILILLGTGVYLALSRQLHHNFDETLRSRAEQVARFKDIIPMVAGGVFEEEPGERVSFYYYVDGRLSDISHKNRAITITTLEIEALFDMIGEGQGQFIEYSEVMENGTVRRFRGGAVGYVPSDPVIRLDRFRNQDEKRRSQSPPTQKQRGRRQDQKESLPPPPPRQQVWPKSERQIPPKSEISPQQKTIEIERALLIVARPTTAMENVLDRLFHILLAAFPITLILSGGGGIFLLRRILNPVGKIVRVAQEIEAEDLSRRIDVTGKDELGLLAGTLNHMIERLEKAFIRQKELTGDASHELRTPLAVIQAEATLALQKQRDAVSYRNALEVIARECEFMSKIIGQLLILARADSDKSALTLNRIELKPFLRVLCEDIEVLCLEKEQKLHIDLPKPSKSDIGSLEREKEGGREVPIRADSKSLKRLMLNLLSNAIHYTPKGGEIRVSLSRKNNKAVIAISDNGIGIPETALPHIFDRFYRVDKARSRKTGGSGLGLAICRSIVEMHGGTISVDSVLDQGTTITVTFPIAS